jgi:hypothetical protein
MNGLQHAVTIPEVEVVEDRAPRRQIFWQITPLASPLTISRMFTVRLRPPRLAGGIRGDMLPFFVGQIAWVPQMVALITFTVLDGPHSAAPLHRIRPHPLNHK